jgi:hypothetical protein
VTIYSLSLSDEEVEILDFVVRHWIRMDGAALPKNLAVVKKLQKRIERLIESPWEE